MAAIVVSLVAFLAVSFIISSVLSVPTERRALLKQRIGGYVPRVSTPRLTTIDVLRTRRPGLTPSLDKIVEGTSFADRLSLDLIRASLPLRPGEYVAIHVAAVAASFALASFVLDNLLLGIVAAPVSYLAVRLFVRHRQRARLKAFESQLPDAIDLINTSLKSGFGLLQGIETVAREAPEPVRDEFSQVIRDISLGIQLEGALAGLCHRVPSHDVYLVVTAVTIHRTVGGNLTEVLASIAATVRARLRLRDEVHALTTTARVSSYVVSALPFVVFVATSIINPRYASLLITTSLGRIMLIAGGVLMAIGMYLSKRFAELDY